MLPVSTANADQHELEQILNELPENQLFIVVVSDYLPAIMERDAQKVKFEVI